MSKYGKLLASTTKHLKALGGGSLSSGGTATLQAGHRDKKTAESDKTAKSKKKVSACLAKIVDLLNSSDAKDLKEKPLPFDKPESDKTSSSSPAESSPSSVEPSVTRAVSSELHDLMTPLVSGDLPLLIFSRMQLLEKEDFKNIQHMYQFLFRHKRAETVAYVTQHPQIIHILVQGYNNKLIALTSGALLRELVRDEEINCLFLNSKELLDPFFTFVQSEAFDLAADAFETLKLVLTKHPKACGKWLQDHTDAFLLKYNPLVAKGGYVTKRQALKLMGELLTSRTNFHFMMSYINNPEQLEQIITCFSDSQKAIKFEAFHVFKIFVANPRKSQAVIDILVRERANLELFLQNFDWLKFKEQFSDEKAMILSVLTSLPPASSSSVSASTDLSGGGKEGKKPVS